MCRVVEYSCIQLQAAHSLWSVRVCMLFNGQQSHLQLIRQRAPVAAITCTAMLDLFMATNRYLAMLVCVIAADFVMQLTSYALHTIMQAVPHTTTC
jgi:type II secretory pathway component PulL